MLWSLFSLFTLLITNYGQPEFIGSEYFVINECTAYGSGDGSRICYCSDGTDVENQEGSVHCYYYDNSECGGEYSGSDHYGGCDTDGYLYMVEGCSDAQQAASEGSCMHWVDDEDNIYPIEECLYGGDGGNCDQGASSCRFGCSGGLTFLYYWDDNYICDGNDNGAPQNISDNQWTCADQGTSICAVESSTCTTGALKDCSVRVDKYDHSDLCQSDDTKWKTKTPQQSCNYYSLSTNYQIGLDECASETYGYFEFQYKFICQDGNIAEYHYLGNDCKDGPTIESGTSGMWVSTYNGTANDDIICSNEEVCSVSTEDYSRYGCGSGYYSYNAETTDYERPRAFGICMPYTDYDMDLPWYSDLYYTISLYQKASRNIFYYFDSACESRNYLVERLDGTSSSSYKCKRKYKGGFNNKKNFIGNKFFNCR